MRVRALPRGRPRRGEINGRCPHFIQIISHTTAAIENLDLMIMVDTAIGHLSGSLGKKTWMLLPSHAEWRWHLDMDYSPWYEDVRLFRHKEHGKKDWDEMIERVIKSLLDELL